MTTPRRDIATATGRMRALLDRLGTPAAVRLWDGTAITPSAGTPPCFTIVVRSRRTLLHLLEHPTALRFGEAFIGEEIDIEGDLFEAMRAAHRLADGQRRPGTALVNP